jgi:mycothiol synthase
VIQLRVHRPVAPEDVTAIRIVSDAAESADGHPSLGDEVWRDLAMPGDDTALVVAYDGTDPVGALHLRTQDGDAIAGVVVRPDHRGGGVATDLLHRAIAELGAPPRHLQLWAFGADERADAFARASQLRTERELWQMRVSLPLPERPVWPDGVTVRPFEPGRDEQAWLAVNARAFAEDPDQGRWSAHDLRRREAEPWFDPSGFLLAEVGDELAGFCWTKIHPSAPPHEPDALGEIYVIGVDPGHRGTGLGRALVTGGLDSLHERGTRVGMLFVDAVNAPAVRLYRALGFAVARVDRAYGRDLP